jgi:hypothetical protein
MRVCLSSAATDQDNCRDFVYADIVFIQKLKQEFGSCLIFYDAPKNITSAEATEIVRNWLQAHPDRNQESIEASSLVDAAMSVAYPCTR